MLPVRARSRTALGLTLVGLAVAAPVQAPVQAQVAWQNVAAAQSTAAYAPLQTPVVQKGTVLWRRLGNESERTPTPAVSDEIERLQQALQATSQQLAGLEQKIDSTADLRTQTAATVTNVTSLAQESIRAMERMAEQTAATTDLKLSKAQLENRLAVVEEARLAAKDAEDRARAYTGAQIAELRNLAQTETANVAAALRIYADLQLAQAQATTSATLANLAQATRQSVTDLDQRTNQRMGVLWQAANIQAEKLANEKAAAVAASLAALQQQTAADKLEPAQIRAIAEQTVANSAPEFRALALQTLKDGQDYIRSVARSAVQDADPGMTAALANAARDVITKDDKVVFAIRKAVAEELQGLATGATATTTPDGRTVLGPDHGSGTPEVELDPNRLRIAQLLAPEGGLAPDAALTPAQLAALSPAAGPAQGHTAVGGQQAWSAQGTSLLRPRPRSSWMDLRQYKVVLHQDNQTLEELLADILKRAEPFTGPWQVRWKITEPNRDLMQERFSLDAEAPFEEFISYLAQYIVNDRGVKLSVSLFDSERIIVISD